MKKEKYKRLKKKIISAALSLSIIGGTLYYSIPARADTFNGNSQIDWKGDTLYVDDGRDNTIDRTIAVSSDIDLYIEGTSSLNNYDSATGEIGYIGINGEGIVYVDSTQASIGQIINNKNSATAGMVVQSGAVLNCGDIYNNGRI